MGFISGVGSALVARSAAVLADIPLPLRETGAFRKWVLEQPIPLTVILALVGIVICYFMRAQGKQRQGIRIATVLGVASAGVFAAGTLVETEQERLKARARELVAAVAKADSMLVGPMLAEEAVGSPWGLSRDVMLNKIESTLGRSVVIKEHKVGALRAALDGSNSARTQLRVHVVADGALYSGPVGSWWMIRWKKESSGQWKAVEIEMQQLDMVSDVSSLRP